MMHHGSTRPRSGAGLAALLTIACNGGEGDTGFVDPSMSTPIETSAAETTAADTTGEPPTSSESSSTTADATTGDPSTTSGGSDCADHDDCADHPNGPVCSGGHCTSVCAPGTTKNCYSGPDGTLDVGPCRRGVQTCSDDGATWSACAGEVLPAAEVCANTIDDDCNGAVDDDADADGDGWGACAGDCCDVDGGACFDAAQVNPGAFEWVGNQVDDDCDGEVDEAEPTCDDGLASDSADPLAYARALDLCTFTTESPADPKDRTWGVISGGLTLADGTGAPAAASRSIRSGFGNLLTPQRGSRLAVLASGHAADAADANPPFAAFESGKDMKTTSPPPQDWLAANAGKLPNPEGCPAPAVPAANDAVLLSFKIRVPTNAKSFSARMYFFSAEYPEWVCSDYNDFFVALVDSGADNPADKNVAVYDDGMTKWPIGVNLALVADGLFRQCDNGTVGCAEDMDSQYGGCDGTAELAGTGFDAFDDFACDPNQKHAGGGTGWLTLRGNVEPGEVMTVRLAVWDSGGHIYDSLVLLDAWEWSLEPAKPGVIPG